VRCSDKFDISGLEAEDIDEALELVEEVEASSEDESFWGPCLDRILVPAERAGRRSGPGPAPLKLETGSSAARSTVENGEPPTEPDRAPCRRRPSPCAPRSRWTSAGAAAMGLPPI
jgi:hypothetical protein